MRDWSRFDAFLNNLQGDVYPEPPSEPAVSITRNAIENLWNNGLIRTGDRVLDVGCGQRAPWSIFVSSGYTRRALPSERTLMPVTKRA